MKKLTILLFLLLAIGNTQDITKINGMDLYYTDYKVLKNYPDIIDSNVYIDFFIKEYAKINITIFDGYYVMKNVYVDSLLPKGYYTISIPMYDLKQNEYMYEFVMADTNNIVVFSKKYKIYKTSKTQHNLSNTINNTISNDVYQKPRFGLGFGISIASTKYSQLGISVSSLIGSVFFDVNITTDRGKGQPLKFQSSKTYKQSNSTYWASLNIGYMINISEQINIVPNVGYYSTSDIYNDPIGWNTWFTKPNGSGVSIGTNLLITTTHMFASIGLNTFEHIKMTVGFIL